MYLPLLEKEASRLNVALECCDMPVFIDSVLLSRAGGAVSVVSSRLTSNQKAYAHAVNLGKYSAMLEKIHDIDSYAKQWAYDLLGCNRATFE